MINLSNGLTGLSLLSGSNSFLGLGGTSGTFETGAVRMARAQFTLPEIPPPWKTAGKAPPVSAQVAAIKRMASLVDKAVTGANALPEDVQTAFTAYKALDRLRLLAETAAAQTTGSGERTLLQTVFAKGLDDLQSFLGAAPSDALNLAFAQPARRAESLPVIAPASLLAAKIAGVGVAAARDAALPGMTGDEKFLISLSNAGTSAVVTVDLAGTARPPTLDSVAGAINAAIAAAPGWSVRFTPTKADGKWGFSIERAGTERVAIDQIGAGDALMVATGTTSADASAFVRMLRFDQPDGAMERRTLGTVAGIDGNATERARIADAKAGQVLAPTTAAAIATDAQGFSYVVGTTTGDVGTSPSDGNEDLFLTKLDSEGAVVWQRALGAAGAAQGAAVTVAADGDIVVAGTVRGGFDGASSDGDMLVARFSSSGDEEMSKLVRAAGADRASAVAVGADGTIFVGGRSSGGDAFLARVDAAGREVERRAIDSGGTDGVTALAVDAAGNLLALTREDAESKLQRLDGAALSNTLATANLGAIDARAMARAADGGIAVVGARLVGGGRDGFVTRLDASLTDLGTTSIATAGDDQLDSAAFLNGALYVGGRTTGVLDGTRQGTVDGFVSRIDAATGQVQSNRQFGLAGSRAEPVRVAAARGGNTVLGALGLHRGVLTSDGSAKLVAQTGLRVGDEFSLRVEGGALRKIVVGADDTLTTLADRVRRITGSKATVSTPKVGAGNVLRIEMKTGFEAELVAGADGRDALAKLGLPAARIFAPDPVAKNAPRVRPGGSFGLDLTDALAIGTREDAGVALARIKSAISITQTGYRSLYWDEGKAALVDGAGAGGASTAREQAQMTQYQAALDRLSGGSPANIFGF